MPVIDVIVNRSARRLRAEGPLIGALRGAATRGGARVHETTTLDELERSARQIAGATTEGVILAGGDGSHMAGLSALSRAFGGELPPVALAPGGTVGTVARNLGMKGSAMRWTERVVSAVCEGAARLEHRPTLRVRDNAGGDRVGFIFGAGLVARFFELYDAAPRKGHAAAARLAARVFAGAFVGAPLARRVLDSAQCTLVVDGKAQTSRRWSLVVASVLRDVGLHLRVTYRAGETADRFHLVASGLPARALARQTARVFSGRPLRGDPHVDAMAGSLRLRFDAPPRAYVLDGDLLPASEVSVEMGPVLALLVP